MVALAFLCRGLCAPSSNLHSITACLAEILRTCGERKCPGEVREAPGTGLAKLPELSRRARAAGSRGATCRQISLSGARPMCVTGATTEKSPARGSARLSSSAAATVSAGVACTHTAHTPQGTRLYNSAGVVQIASVGG